MSLKKYFGHFGSAVILISLMLICNIPQGEISAQVQTPGSPPPPVSAQPTTINNFLTYEDTANGLTMIYPANWEKQSIQGDTIFISPPENNADQFRESLGINVRNLPAASTTLDEFTQTMVSSLRQSYPSIPEATSTTLAGNKPANTVTFSTDSQGRTETLQAWTIAGGKAYVVTYSYEKSQFQNYFPTIKRILDSIQISGPSSSPPPPGPQVSPPSSIQQPPQTGEPRITTNDTATTTTIPRVEAEGNITGGNFLTYENPTHGMRMLYPSDWNKAEVDLTPYDYFMEVAQFTVPFESELDEFAETVYVSIEDLEYANENLDNYLDYVVEGRQAQDIEGFQIINYTTKATLAGRPAYSFETTEGNGQYRTMETGTIINDKVYKIFYDAETDKYSLYLPNVKKMIESFQITAK
jgi:hypothetical protein